MNTFPWWFQKLLLHYLPHYVVRLLEDPWIIGAIVGAFFIIKFITVSYITYKLVQERKKRKQLEAENAKLIEKCEQQQTALFTLMSKKISTPDKVQQQPPAQ